MGKKSVFCKFDRVTPFKNTFILFIGQKYVGDGVFYDSGVSSRKSPGQPRLQILVGPVMNSHSTWCISLVQPV